MRINNISNNIPKININKKQVVNKNPNITFEGSNKDSNARMNAIRAGAGASAILLLLGATSGCRQLGTQIDVHNATSSKIGLADVGFVSLPITEFYFTNGGKEVSIYPDETLKRNDNDNNCFTPKRFIVIQMRGW